MDTTTEVKSRKRRSRSLATRRDIIEATISCFVDIGFVRTTTTEIAKKANVTRGAVQHYFPTTQHVLTASIEYLLEEWIGAYNDVSRKTPRGKDFIDHAVDNMWELVNNRLFVAWMELVAASRTDPELRAIIEPVAEEYEQARRRAGRDAYPDFAAAEYEKFEHNRDTLRFLLEGMATTVITYDRERRVEAQLQWIKDRLHESWLPERNKIRIQE
ncbi:MAG: TetR/AcrR family transcriptional regulator [Alphaproteobacteria bacterium]